MSRIDDKFAALRDQGFTGSLSDMILQWLQDAGATSNSVSTAWAQALYIRGYRGQRNDAWYELLGDLGFEGALADRDAQFWALGDILPRPWTVNFLGQQWGFLNNNVQNSGGAYNVEADILGFGNGSVYRVFDFRQDISTSSPTIHKASGGNFQWNAGSGPILGRVELGLYAYLQFSFDETLAPIDPLDWDNNTIGANRAGTGERFIGQIHRLEVTGPSVINPFQMEGIILSSTMPTDTNMYNPAGDIIGEWFGLDPVEPYVLASQALP